MNPLTNIRNQNKINELELNLGYTGVSGKSWHQKYADSAWIYVGGLPFDLNEGDLIAVFSQYGEIVNINLVRDKKTGKSRGFAFICYFDQRSTILAVDNFNGIKLLKRVIRVDHVEEYKVPKYREDIDAETLKIWEEGCAAKPIIVEKQDSDEEDPVEKLRKKGLLDQEGVLKADESLKKELKKEKKRLKKEMKRSKKEERRRKKMQVAEELGVKLEPSEDSDTWKNQKKPIESGPVTEEDLYGNNKHFNFGKPRKEIPPPPTHNPRPDFEKADWRDIEMWKAVREREKLEKGETQTKWKEEEHYLPSRFHD